MGLFGFGKVKEEDKTNDEKKLEKTMEISAIELDALKETANIGTGHASMALSTIFKKKVNISLPILELTNSQEISSKISTPDEMIVGIYSKIMQGMEGNIITIIPIESALSITNTFLLEDKKSDEGLSEQDKKLLQRVGTAIYASYLTSLAKFFETKITFEPPNVISTFGSSIQDFLVLNMGNTDKLLLIKLGFNIEETEIKGDFLLLFSSESLAPLLSSIRKKITR